ncbi:MAG TPA: endonuclease/exonuclease/phosphatase family protein [Burkholderiales bacterium]|nr:endonuclease/exonuclease/phosphatase family protein [Burkholderiales bacterium]
MGLTVATYNIHRCVGRDRRFDPKRILTVLHELDADVIALQELLWDPQDALHLLDHFAAELTYRAIPGPTLQRRDGHYGNAILTRLPIHSVNDIDLSVRRCEARGAIDAVLGRPGESIRVIATHLGLWPAERRKQMRRLLALLAGTAINPTVLMGDLNEWFLWGRPLRWLHAYFGYTRAPATYPTRFPLFALDRIWIKPALTSIPMAVVTPLTRAASDHFPLRAVVR